MLHEDPRRRRPLGEGGQRGAGRAGRAPRAPPAPRSWGGCARGSSCRRRGSAWRRRWRPRPSARASRPTSWRSSPSRPSASGPGSMLTRSARRARRRALGRATASSCRGGGATARVKTIPEAVKRDHAAELDELKAARKELKALLPPSGRGSSGCSRGRTAGRSPTWRERYLDHPVVGSLARRLIWRVGDEPRDLVGREAGRPPRPRAGRRTTTRAVSLWHPIESDVETVQGWRLWLEQHLVVQPFKQAHREVYLLTDAERETRHLLQPLRRAHPAPAPAREPAARARLALHAAGRVGLGEHADARCSRTTS